MKLLWCFCTVILYFIDCNFNHFSSVLQSRKTIVIYQYRNNRLIYFYRQYCTFFSLHQEYNYPLLLAAFKTGFLAGMNSDQLCLRKENNWLITHLYIIYKLVASYSFAICTMSLNRQLLYFYYWRSYFYCNLYVRVGSLCLIIRISNKIIKIFMQNNWFACVKKYNFLALLYCIAFYIQYFFLYITFILLFKIFCSDLHQQADASLRTIMCILSEWRFILIKTRVLFKCKNVKGLEMTPTPLLERFHSKNISYSHQYHLRFVSNIVLHVFMFWVPRVYRTRVEQWNDYILLNTLISHIRRSVIY